MFDRHRSIDLHVLTRTSDPTHKQKALYSLTGKAIQLVPVFAQIGAWGRRHLQVSEELSIRAERLEDGGPDMWCALMDELRHLHLGIGPAIPPEESVRGELQRAFEAVVQRKKERGSK